MVTIRHNCNKMAALITESVSRKSVVLEILLLCWRVFCICTACLVAECMLACSYKAPHNDACQADGSAYCVSFVWIPEQKNRAKTEICHAEKGKTYYTYNVTPFLIGSNVRHEAVGLEPHLCVEPFQLIYQNLNVASSSNLHLVSCFQLFYIFVIPGDTWCWSRFGAQLSETSCLCWKIGCESWNCLSMNSSESLSFTKVLTAQLKTIRLQDCLKTVNKVCNSLDLWVTQYHFQNS